MAKLILLALTFTALVAFASAHTTIITTTVQEKSRGSTQQYCSRKLQGQQFDQCQRYLQQGQGQGQQQQGIIQSCCNELENVDEACQCEAVKQVFRDVQRQQQQQQHEGGRSGSQQVQQLKQQAQNLPNKCNLQTRQCQIGTIFTTITTITEENDENFRRDPQQCQDVKRQSFNQCQRYVQQQTSGPGRLLMSINRQQQQPQSLQLCCNELRNVDEDCMCEAIQEVYWKSQQQGGRRGGSQQQMRQELKQVVQNLGNQCGLEAEQCRIPSAML